MGGIPEALDNARPWHVEVRTESFYLHAEHSAGDDAPHLQKEFQGDPQIHVLDFLLDEAGAMAAALDQVLAHPAYGRHKAAHGDGGKGRYRLSLAGHRLAIVGPFAMVGTGVPEGRPRGEDDPRPHETYAEIEYADLAGLRAELGAEIDGTR